MGIAILRNLVILSVVALAALLSAACAESSPTPAAGPPIYPDAQPGSDWTRVVAPGWSDQAGFSLMLPTGWEFMELQGIDSYVGEVTGDGMRLTFDYGRYSWSLNPEDEPEHEYIVQFEEFGGREAKLLLPVDSTTSSSEPYEAATGVYFGNLDDGYELNIVGRGLTQEQQRVAVAIFRSIRLLE